MAVTIDDVKKNIAYKQLPIVILDERYHRLFPENKKTPEIRHLEKELSELLKKQGQITNDLKAVRKIKADLMKEILENAENPALSEAKRQKLMNRNQRLVIEAKEKIETLEQEELEIPGLIRNANIALVIEAVDVCYLRIHKNYDDIQLLGKWINEMRIELKKKILIKQDKETSNTEIYSYMHDLLGPEVMEIFDSKTGTEDKGKK
ncbi:MAG: hypothetical protein ACI4EW_07220 [Butyrivibrio sp.]